MIFWPEVWDAQPIKIHRGGVKYSRRKTGTTICSLLVSAVLLKWDMIYVIIGIGILSIMEIFITIKLYLMLIAVDDKDNYNKIKKITNKKKEAINQ